jgi:hypothetical protein
MALKFSIFPIKPDSPHLKLLDDKDMYLSHYNLLRKPFQLTTDPRFLWLGEKHQIENGQASIDPEAELFKPPE